MTTRLRNLLFLVYVVSAIPGCGLGIKGGVEVDIPGDNEFGIVLREMSVPTLSTELRAKRSVEEYGFDTTQVFSREAAMSYFPGEVITVPVEKYFCLDCPTVPTYGIQPFFEHYAAATTYAYQLWNAWQQCLAAAPPPVTPPPSECTKPCKAPCLWKPLSESNGNPALLMPKSFEGQKVTFSDPGLKVTREACCPNGNRQHWWTNKPAGAIDKNLVIRFSNGDCRLIPDPTKRYE